MTRHRVTLRVLWFAGTKTETGENDSRQGAKHARFGIILKTLVIICSDLGVLGALCVGDIPRLDLQLNHRPFSINTVRELYQSVRLSLH